MGLQSLNDVNRLVALEKLPNGFHEALGAELSLLKLRGLGLFSGGGSLDRGLEAGGAVEFETSVDYDSAAIHTQRANCKDLQNMRLYCGSVDDYLDSLLSNRENRLVARIGEVDLISAGSPCPGFSSLQQNKQSPQSLIYASHITTFCTAVDMYRPLYGILENVVNMASTHKGLEDQNILSQLVACLVSMGYQVNQFIMDSWTYGSCQQRSRIILTIAGPGLEPILQRPHTHSRSFEDTVSRSLGKLPNGERFGGREHYATPFSHVSAQEATSDLLNIGNGNVQACIPYPDHRLSWPTTSRNRALLECIPRWPPGCGYAEAMRLDLVPPLLQITKKETGRAYQRIKADNLVPTVTTETHIQDARNGAAVHWAQHRPLSIQEARRTQGYLDHEPIIGTLGERWGIIGNGVDRKGAFSLGLSLRDAYVNSKRVLPLSEGLDDEAELLVDVEVDDEEQPSATREQTTFIPIEVVSRSSSSLSSTDSFASTRKTRARSDSLSSLNGAHNESSTDSRMTPPLEPSGTVTQLVTDVSVLSRLSQNVTTKVGKLSMSALPALPTFLQPVKLEPSTKRQRDDSGEEQQTDMTHIGPSKRAKVVEARRTISPDGTILEDDMKPEIRRSSLPLRSSHTRNSGPAEFAPRAWHKRIGDSSNVIELS
ncbi:hypothetical protein OPT61_g4983 [Boeremia exigua]|uniref:Uncharacterized protein n=1 Tax=Boeremia exigua TaxID=749465 RepID=A0ACC2IC29_9PLEO|nr:hypothetical protein OPT61_g4983 [Boeremia exigua]